MRNRILTVSMLVICAGLPVTVPAKTVDLRETRESLRLLNELASIPSQSDNATGVRQAADWLVSQFTSLGMAARILEAEPGAGPLVFAEHDPGLSGAPTILFYMHYDTQPTGPAGDWQSTDGEPFAPRLMSRRYDEPGARPMRVEELDRSTLGTARVYARGIADDKAPIVMHLRALRRWLDTPAARRLHLKYILDGEEEVGSPHIEASLERHGAAIEADLLVMCDGPMDAAGRPSIYLGTRGDMHMKLTVRTASSSAHSGNYGLLPNAAWRMAALLATMKDARGNVTVDGFLDDVVPPTGDERVALAEASRAEPIIAENLGVEQFEGDPLVPYYERLLFRPGLIINQLIAGRPGNQIPHHAEALLEVRLVTDQDPREVYETFRRHVERHMPAAVLEYLDGTRAARMDPADPMVARGIEAVRAAAGSELIVYPSLGGTLPLLHAFAAAGHSYMGLPLVNFDNNQHVSNENLRVQVLGDGVALLERFLNHLADE